MKIPFKRIVSLACVLAMCMAVLPTGTLADEPVSGSVSSSVVTSDVTGAAQQPDADVVTDPADGTPAPDSTPVPDSTPAPADDGAPAAPTANGPAAQIGDVTYETLDEAVKAAADGAVIELLGDATTEGLNLSKDLTIQAAEGLTTKPTLTFTKYGIALWGKALTFRNIDVVMTGIGSTPYTAEWSWMAICASKNASLSLDNVVMTMDATGVTNNPHAIYFCSNNKLNLENGTVLTIRNYPQDALEWDGGDGGYNVNITDSTFISDHNRSGFTGTFYATITNSQVDVINSLGNGSNGSHFIIQDSTINFNDNGSHGLSAGELRIDHSTVTTTGNKGMGIAVNNNLSVTNQSVVTVSDNASNASYGYAGVRLYNDCSFVIDGTSQVYINNNHNTGLYVRRGNLNVAEGAVLEITGNVVSNMLLDGYGGGLYVGYGNNYDPTVTLPAGVKLYNNHSLSGGDDIYVSEGVNGPSLTFGKVGTDWVLDGDPDCTDAIDGWYDDSETARWNAHDSTALHMEELTGFDAATGLKTVGPLTYLKAAHGLMDLTLQPADITIYMGGGNGYEGVADSDGSISGSNSLPEPGYYLTLPDSVNKVLEDAGLTVSGEQPADLSAYISLYALDDAGEVAGSWQLARYGNTHSAALGKYIYAITPVGDTNPFRLTFTDVNDPTNVFDSDSFQPSQEGALHQQYTMNIYQELLAAGKVVARLTLPDSSYTYSFQISSLPGSLDIRYVTGDQDSVVTPAYDSVEEASAADDPNKTALDNAYMVRGENTKFFINGSSVDVTESEDFAQVSLLFDDVITASTTEGMADYATQLRDQAIEQVDQSFDNLKYEAKYLDLVDANNGNVWLTPSEDVTVYWPYPEGTDANTTFYLVHFVGLDREMDNADIAADINSAEKVVVPVTTDAYGISFQTDSFSPYVLLWNGKAEEPGTPATPTATPTPTAGPVGTPATGDAAPVVLFGGAALLAALSLTTLVVLRKRYNH